MRSLQVRIPPIKVKHLTWRGKNGVCEANPIIGLFSKRKWLWGGGKGRVRKKSVTPILKCGLKREIGRPLPILTGLLNYTGTSTSWQNKPECGREGTFSGSWHVNLQRVSEEDGNSRFQKVCRVQGCRPKKTGERVGRGEGLKVAKES